MDTFKCLINNQEYILNINRTSIIISNDNSKKILGFFDIRYFIYDNRLFIEDNYDTNLIITGNNIKILYKTITKYISNLRYEIKISDLIVDNIKNTDFNCIICLEKKNTDIIKLKCCNNMLHYYCYLDYLKNIDDYRCPICRNEECPICFGLGC
jgi:hypothetical protein